MNRFDLFRRFNELGKKIAVMWSRPDCVHRIANAGSVGRTDPNIATSWAEAHGCGKSGNGFGLGTMGSTTPSRNISPRS
jgi:hypothetical protein